MGLPLLDIGVWRSDPQKFVRALRHACHHDGFFQLRHGVPAPVTRRLVTEAQTFFARSAEDKQRIDYSRSPAFRGYMATGVENTAGKPDLREQVEIAAEGLAASADAWPAYERLRGPNQWPPTQPSLREAVDEYTDHMLVVSREMTRALALALDLGIDALDGLFSPAPHWQLKLASYQPAAASAEEQIGVGAHTDSGFLTMLLQDENGGLQAFTRGAWADVPPLGPEVVVCNLGEVAELLSGGYLLATPHRVLSTPAARLSIPFFFNPSLETVVQPLALPGSLEWEREASYDSQSHWRRPSNAMLPAYGANAFKSLARSHPAVFAAHHPDLRVLEDGRVVRHASDDADS
jgi:isopenicillin N synthase-like dioxygenase